jgi:hypothetical protein
MTHSLGLASRPADPFAPRGALSHRLGSRRRRKDATGRTVEWAQPRYVVAITLWFRIALTLTVALVAAANFSHGVLRVVFVCVAIVMVAVAWAPDALRRMRRRSSD